MLLGHKLKVNESTLYISIFKQKHINTLNKVMYLSADKTVVTRGSKESNPVIP